MSKTLRELCKHGWGTLAPAVRDSVRVRPWQATITPVLTVGDGTATVTFYERALGAREVWRTTSRGGIVAELGIADARLRVADEAPETGDLGPRSLGGTAVRINLFVEDPDATAARAIALGAREIAPVADQPYGLRQGRLEDPFGHHWLIGRPLSGDAGDWALVLTCQARSRREACRFCAGGESSAAARRRRCLAEAGRFR